MIKIECYEVKTVKPNDEYFMGGNSSPFTPEYECFMTEQEAIDAKNKKMKKIEKNMGWCSWWIQKYLTDQYFTVTKVVKKF